MLKRIKSFFGFRKEEKSEPTIVRKTGNVGWSESAPPKRKPVAPSNPSVRVSSDRSSSSRSSDDVYTGYSSIGYSSNYGSDSSSCDSGSSGGD